MKNIPNRKYSTKNKNDDYEFLKREILDKFVGNPKIFNETVRNLDDMSGEYADTYFFEIRRKGMNIRVKKKTRPAIYPRGEIVVEYHAEKMFAEWLARRGIDFSSDDGKVVEFKFDPERSVGHDGKLFSIMCHIHDVHQYYNRKPTKEQQKIINITKGRALRILTKWENNTE